MSEENKENVTNDVKIRFTVPADGLAIKEWFSEPDIMHWFPIVNDPVEIDDTINRWMYWCRYKSSLTATINNQPVGVATFYPQPYKKIQHQAELTVFVDPKHRNKKIGLKLMNHLMHLAKTNFKMTMLHLQVYEGNPAYNFYKRLGFIEFGKQSHWIIEEDGKPRARIFMERFL